MLNGLGWADRYFIVYRVYSYFSVYLPLYARMSEKKTDTSRLLLELENTKAGTVFTHESVDDPIQLLYLNATAIVADMTSEQIRARIGNNRSRAEIQSETWLNIRERLIISGASKRKDLLIPPKRIFDGLRDHLVRVRCVTVKRDSYKQTGNGIQTHH